MSSDIAIQVSNLSKCYQIYDKPQDRLKQSLWRGYKQFYREFWALKEVSFTIKQGETVGIVGSNGSGKSTLLQIISNILAPSSGSVKANGRVAALLELGAGFNPEFTGRENIYMNASIMGMSRNEIDNKYDDIVAFADIGDFIDQPVKMYSSGMYVRLAFAVAINLNPDILIVDEALSVGDEAFQRKCFSRIQSIQEQGATILFVSHAASSIIELCNRAILFDHGELLLSGAPKLVIAQYHKLIYAPADMSTLLREEIRAIDQKIPLSSSNTHSLGSELSEAPKEKELAQTAYYDPNLIPKSTISYEPLGARIENPHITTLEGEIVNVLLRREAYLYTYDVEFLNAAELVRFGMVIKSITGVELGGAVFPTRSNPVKKVKAGEKATVKWQFNCLLQPGVYFLNAGVFGRVNDEERYLHRCIDIAMFRVQEDEHQIATAMVDFNITPSFSVSSSASNLSNIFSCKESL